MVSARSPFSGGEVPAPLADRDRARERRKHLGEVFRCLERYAKEAKVRGWSGPEQVYRLAIVRLREDLLNEKEE